MKKYWIGGVAFTAIVGTTAAFAQTAQPAPATQHARHYFAKPEARADVQQHVQRMFAQLDTNRDGFIGRDEVAAAEAQFQAHAQQRAAQHGDAGHSKAFDRIDANHDGMISRAEFDATRPPHARAGRGFHGFGSRMFDTADSNKDGRVSQAEAQQLALQHFDQADLNHDGTLTPDERKQARSLMRHPG